MHTINSKAWYQWRDAFYAKQRAVTIGQAFVKDHGKDPAKNADIVNMKNQDAEQLIQERFVTF